MIWKWQHTYVPRWAKEGQGPSEPQHPCLLSSISSWMRPLSMQVSAPRPAFLSTAPPLWLTYRSRWAWTSPFLGLLNSSDLLFSPLLPLSTRSGHRPYHQQLQVPFFWNTKWRHPCSQMAISHISRCFTHLFLRYLVITWVLRCSSPQMLLSSLPSPTNLRQIRFHDPTVQSLSYQCCKLPCPFVLTLPTRQKSQFWKNPISLLWAMHSCCLQRQENKS